MESEWEFDNEWVEASFENYIQEIKAGYELIDIMESLLQYAAIPEERKERLYKDIYTLSYEDSIKLINELQEKQVNRIHAGINYNMTYIKNFMKKSI